MSKRQDVEIIYRYVVLNESMEKIGQALGISYSDVSLLLTPYHMGGRENKSGDGNWSSGKNRGRYRNGFYYTDEAGNSQCVNVTQEVIMGYVNANWNFEPKQTLEEYLQSTYEQPMRPSYRRNASSVSSYDGYSAGTRRGFSLPIKPFVIAIIVFAVIVAIVKVNPISFSSNFSLFGKSGEVETVKKGQWEYLGEIKRDNPNGINIRCQRLDEPPYEIGVFNKKEEVSGEGVSFDNYGINLIIGARTKAEFHKAWCLQCMPKSNEVILAYFKSGVPTGVGIYYDGQTSSIVNFDKNKDVVATFEDGEWKKPNGKILKLSKNNSYKKITIIDNYNYKIKDSEFCIDPDALKYHSDTFLFEGTESKFAATYYEKNRNIKINYDKDAREIVMESISETGAGYGRRLYYED